MGLHSAMLSVPLAVTVYLYLSPRKFCRNTAAIIERMFLKIGMSVLLSDASLQIFQRFISDFQTDVSILL
jgi:hypothetical protein